eukprot:5040688-Prymnesium_polylepis.1
MRAGNRTHAREPHLGCPVSLELRVSQEHPQHTLSLPAPPHAWTARSPACRCAAAAVQPVTVASQS